MSQNNQPDWNKLKAEYIKGGTSYRRLAAKHGVPFDTLKRVAVRDGWQEARRKVDDKTAAEMPGKVADAIVEEAAAIAGRHFGMWGELLDKTKTELGKVAGTRDLRDLASVIKLATEGQRLAAGMPDKPQQSDDIDDPLDRLTAAIDASRKQDEMKAARKIVTEILAAKGISIPEDDRGFGDLDAAARAILEELGEAG